MTIAKLSFFLAAAAAAIVVVPATPVVFQSALPSFPRGVGNATYDGNCTYALGDSSFNVTDYVAKPWYQLAASTQPFQVGCECVYAEYAALSDGSGISVHNFCTVPSSGANDINGTASFASSSYGPAGLKVFFPSIPGGGQVPANCAGPNYVVQKLYRDSKKQLEAALVVGPDFNQWFVLSRQQIVSNTIITGYLSDLANMGSQVSGNYNITVQAGCPAAP